MIDSQGFDFSVKESQVTDKSYKLASFASIIESVRAGNEQVSKIEPIINGIEGWLAHGGLNMYEQLVSLNILGHAYNTMRCLTTSPQKANYNDHLIWREVYCYRSIFRLATEISKRRILALYPVAINTRYQADVQLGALYDHFGRFQEAQNLWLQAGHLNNNDYMWRFNIGFSLASTHGYYEKRAEPFVLAHAKRMLHPYLNKPETTRSAKEIYNSIKDWETPDITEDKDVVYDDSEIGRYSKWVNDHWLRLNAYNDINPHSQMSQDDSLFFNAVFSPKGNPQLGQRAFTQLNEIKQEYVSARFMLYVYLTGSGTQHFSDKGVVLSDNADYSNYSFHIELAKSSFRALYSILDKIAYMLNDYLCLGVKDSNVSFKDIWYSDKKKRTIRHEILAFESNYSLAGLLFIRNDIYGGGENYLQDENTERLKAIRNAMEHRSILIVDDGEYDDTQFALIISRGEFEETALSLIRVVRQAIFCVVNLANHIEYDKKEAIKRAGQIVIPQQVSTISDSDKI